MLFSAHGSWNAPQFFTGNQDKEGKDPNKPSAASMLFALAPKKE